MANKQKKRTRYRFDVNFSSLEGKDAFVGRLNRAKQRFSSPGKILARYWSATASFVESFGVPARRRRAKTDHARCKNAQKQHINVARMLEICIHGRQGVFHEFLQRRSVLFLSQCFEIPAMHEQAVTSGLPISFYTVSEPWISFT